MLKIFAKKNTDEKAVILCRNEEVGKQLEYLNSIYGGSWVMVDDFNAPDEILMYKDGMVYSGFNENLKRYSSAMHAVQEKKTESEDPLRFLISIVLDTVKDLPEDHPKKIEAKTTIIKSTLKAIAPKEYQDMVFNEIKAKGLPTHVLLGPNVPPVVKETLLRILPQKNIPGVEMPGIGFAWEKDKLNMM